MAEKRYKAFISYSRKDEKFVKKLHIKLEDYKIPKELYDKYSTLPEKLSPIFRDIEQLKSGDILSSEILNKLHNSENLIVICSPNSAKSKWVNKEIIDFKIKNGESRIFPIIINGIPNSNDENECFPKALRYEIDEQGNLTDTKSDILASNIIKNADGKEFAEIKLISGLLRVENDELWNFEEKRNKKKRMIWGTVWSVIFLMMAGLTISSWIQRDRAVENEIKAKSELFNNIMQQGITFKDYTQEPLKAKFYFSDAINKSTNKNQKKIAKILYNSNTQVNYKLKSIMEHNHSIKGAIYLTNEYILSWSIDGTVKIWDINKSFPVRTYQHRASILGVILINNKDNMISWCTNGDIILWSIFNNKPIRLFNNHCYVHGIKLSKNEKKILSWGEDGKVKIWDINSEKPLKVFSQGKSVDGAFFSNDEKKLVSWNIKESWTFDGNDLKNNVNKQGGIKIWDVKSEKEIIFFRHDEVRGARFFDKEQKILSWGIDINSKHGEIYLWDINSTLPIKIFKHDSIEGAILSKDEKKIFSWGNNGDIKLWSISENKLIKTFKYKSEWIHGIKLTKNEKKILSWDYKGNICLWSIDKDKPLKVFHHYGNVIKAIFSKNEQKILSWDISHAKIKLWDINNTTPLKVIKHGDDYKNSDIGGAIFSSNGKEVLSWGKGYGAHNREIKLWDIDSKMTKIFLNNKGVVAKAKFFKNEEKIFSLNVNWSLTERSAGSVKIWGKDNTKPLKILKNDSPYGVIRNAILSKDEKKVLSISNNDDIFTLDIDGKKGKIQIWNIESEKVLKTFKYNNFLNDAIFTKDETKILSWGGDYKNKGEIKLWDINKTEPLIVFKHNKFVKGAIFSKDEKRILSWSEDDTIKLWDIKTNKLLKSFKHNRVEEVIFFNNDEQLLSWSGIGVLGETNEKYFITLWDIKSGKTLKKFKHNEGIGGIFISKDKKRFISWSNDKMVKLWSIDNEKPLRVFKHDSFVNGAIFSKDEEKILSWSDDGTVRLWKINNNKPLIIFKHDSEVKGAIFSKDEIQILSWGGELDKKGEIRLWDVNTKKLLKVNKYNDEVYGATFSKDEEKILSWSRDGKIRLDVLYENKKIDKNNFLLKTEVDTGTYLSKGGEVKSLSKEEWLQKKERYEQIQKNQTHEPLPKLLHPRPPLQR